ncbi:MAG: energy transducer TonB [Candidatus Korobacteraceae bacterium]
MFEDSLLESSGTLARRPCATAFSFAAQIMLGGILVLISLIYTQALPQKLLMSTVEVPAPPAGAPPPRNVMKSATRSNEAVPDVLTPPSEVPKTIAVIRDEAPSSGNSVGIVGDISGGLPVEPAFPQILRSVPSHAPIAPALKVRVSSGVAQGMLIRQVKPEYPSLARQARVQGTVILQATIGKDGSIENLRVISGHPMLAPAAIDAVKQWRYKPYYLNGEPVEVETYINVNFTLGEG